MFTLLEIIDRNDDIRIVTGIVGGARDGDEGVERGA